MERINRIKEYLQEIITKKQALQDLVKPITNIHQKTYSEWLQNNSSKRIQKSKNNEVLIMELEPEKGILNRLW